MSYQILKGGQDELIGVKDSVEKEIVLDPKTPIPQKNYFQISSREYIIPVKLEPVNDFLNPTYHESNNLNQLQSQLLHRYQL